MTVILVEGESDRAAIEVVASRLGVELPAIVTINGASGARAAAARYRDETLIGLVDANEQRQFEGFVPTAFVCEPDLEGELVRALGIDGVLEVIDSQGELRRSVAFRSNPPSAGRRSPRSCGASSPGAAATSSGTRGFWQPRLRLNGSPRRSSDLFARRRCSASGPLRPAASPAHRAAVDTAPGALVHAQRLRQHGNRAASHANHP